MRLLGLAVACVLTITGVQIVPNTAMAQASASQAEPIPFSENYIALYYFKTTKEPLDIPATAALSEEVRFASPFDKQKRQAAEEERIRKGLETSSSDRLLTVNINTNISAYDPVAKDFSIELFEIGRYIPFSAYNRGFQLIFENAEAYRALTPSEADARRINDKPYARSVTAKVDFHLSGAGDPTGATTSSNTVRAVITKVRLIAGGKPLLPDIVVTAAPTVLPIAQNKSPNEWSVGGLHLGMTKDVFAAAAKDAYGNAPKFEFGQNTSCGDTMLVVPGYTAIVGAVCVTYTTDGSGIVKQFTVKQITGETPESKEGFRKLLVDKFGAVTFTGNYGQFGWGELVGSNSARNYTVYAASYRAKTRGESSSGYGGTPALEITITDPDYARSKLPAQASPMSPKL